MSIYLAFRSPAGRAYVYRTRVPRGASVASVFTATVRGLSSVGCTEIKRVKPGAGRALFRRGKQ